MKFIQPSIPIPLSDAQLAMIGRLSATYGIIETKLLELAATMMGCQVPTAWSALPVHSIMPTMAIISSLMKDKLANQPKIQADITAAFKKLTELASRRNHFIHGFYGVEIDQGGAFVFPKSVTDEKFLNQTYALKARSNKKASIKELPDLINELAVLSCELSHIDWVIRGNSLPSPFQDRI